MCGICGFVGFQDQALLKTMAGCLAHRGPDDEGFYSEGDVSLASRRLSIIDLPTGHQPMTGEDRAVWVTFNGEVYNYRELRELLVKQGHVFATNSDTEVIVHSYEAYGPQAFGRLSGMFAFALWDAKQQTLFLVRDRLGKKPLHYAVTSRGLIFASEVKALLKSPEVRWQVNEQGIDDYLTLRYVPHDQGLFQGIDIVPPGHYAQYQCGRPTLHSYWQLRMDESGPPPPEPECVDRFDSLLRLSVRRRLMSDVPLGLYLSGGLDSAVVARYMAEENHGPLITVSHGFDGQRDELKYARAVSRFLSTEHHEVMIRPEHLDLLPRIIYHMDMPIANSDVVGFYLLARLAREHVKVVLSGEGSDELFGSYVHQKAVVSLNRARRLLPQVLFERVLAPAVRAMPLGLLNAALQYPGNRLDDSARDKLAEFIAGPGVADSYFAANSLFSEREKHDLLTPDFRGRLRESAARAYARSVLEDQAIPALLNRLILLKYKYWLPVYCLLKEDKISMSQSIEQRFPFLDHELVEFMARVPVNLKLRGNVRKYLLRRVARGRLPREIVDRQKGPILVPIAQCFGRSFESLVREVLTEDSVRRRGYFQHAYIRRLLENRARHPFLADRQLFALVALEIWHRIFVDRAYPELLP